MSWWMDRLMAIAALTMASVALMLALSFMVDGVPVMRDLGPSGELHQRGGQDDQDNQHGHQYRDTERTLNAHD